MRHQRYAEAYLPRTPWARLAWWARRQWWAWRGVVTHAPEVADGRNYTGWRAKVTGQHPLGGLPPAGTEAVVTGFRGSGAHRRHRVEFGDAAGAVTLPLPSRCVELTPPDRAG